jgi:hypothetical protein
MASIDDDIEQGLILDTEKDGPEIVRRYIKKYREYFGPNAKRNIARSNKWFMRRVSRDNKISKDRAFFQFMESFNKRGFKDRGLIGRMFLFKYEAKWGEVLPVWDRNPLVFFFGSFVGNGEYGENGVLYLQGIAVHYLPAALRLKLFTALLRFNNDTALREKSKLKLSWQILKGFSQSELAKHCVKTYRADHIQSRLIEINSRYWEIVLFLNLQNFAKGSNSLAWKGVKK